MVTTHTFKKRIFPIVTLMGVDGCGKSTVIKEIEKRLKPDDITVCSIHRMGKKSKGRLAGHYEKPAHSYLVSIMKLLIKAVEWTIKYTTVFLRFKRQGQLVIYDRHYFYSMMVDPLRYRYNASIQIVKWVNRIVPQPQVFILLDAPPEILINRKQEFPSADVRKLVQAYRELINRVPGAYIIDATQPIETVTSRVLEIITPKR